LGEIPGEDRCGAQKGYFLVGQGQGILPALYLRYRKAGEAFLFVNKYVFLYSDRKVSVKIY
jgi:hypothetical protein